uniref:(California timema) hypothetical protein n=1 Tax=Timema californicum TaxID=61474 RepID=A0A7R9P4I0_TIMCA|nr:unnamed protein product [Timema californicum]
MTTIFMIPLPCAFTNFALPLDNLATIITCRPTQAGSHSTNEERLNSSPVRGRTVLPRVKPFNQEFLPDKSRFGPSDRTKISLAQHETSTLANYATEVPVAFLTEPEGTIAHQFARPTKMHTPNDNFTPSITGTGCILNRSGDGYSNPPKEGSHVRVHSSPGVRKTAHQICLNWAEYRDRQQKAEAIETIANFIELSVAEVNKKLHNLRYQMYSEQRKKKKRRVGTKHMVSGPIHENPPKVNEITSKDKSLALSKSENVKKIKSTENNKRRHGLDKDDKLMKDAMAILKEPLNDHVVFGDFVIVELRQLRSEERRKRLNRLTQKAIIAMGEEEEMENYLSNTASLLKNASSSHSYFSGEASTRTAESNYDCVCDDLLSVWANGLRIVQSWHSYDTCTSMFIVRQRAKWQAKMKTEVDIDELPDPKSPQHAETCNQPHSAPLNPSSPQDSETSIEHTPA